MDHRSRTSTFALTAIALLAAGAAYAANIDAQPRKDYGRINFNFDAPTQMQTNSSGNTATITFANPLNASPETLASSLPGYVKDATLSPDKKTLTLNLHKAYRIRQFTSGNRVGVDLIGAAEPTAVASAAPTAAKPDDAILTTKKPASAPVEKSKAKPVVAEKVKAAKPAPAATKKSEPARAILTTKKEPAPVEKKAAAVAEAKKSEPSKAEPTTQAVLTTKKEPEVAAAKPNAEAVLSTKAPEAEKSTPAVAKTDAAPGEKATTPTAAAPAKPIAAAAAETHASAATGPFVTVKAANGQTDLYFAWTDRTAAAVFKRGGDIWIIFSRFKDVNAAALSSQMPKAVTKVTQYADANNTILQLTTDGTINPRIVPVSKGFGWNIALTAPTTVPAQDIALTTDSLEGTQRLILSVFDVAPVLRFFDPTVGDQLAIIPVYEAGRAMMAPKNFPQLNLLNTSQGVAIVSRVPDLVISQTRSGAILSAKSGLAVSENLPVLAANAPVAGTSVSTGVMLPYDQWYVPTPKFLETLMERLHAVAVADKTSKAEAMMEVVKLYLGAGMGAEALGMLNLIHNQYPQYYVTNRLALLSGVSNILANHMDAANAELAAPELNDLDEATLWRQVAALYAPPLSDAQKLEQAAAAPPHSDSSANKPGTVATPEAAAAITATKPPGVQFLKYSRPYIRFYPPRIRQKLATIAADAYLADGQEEKALAVYDTLLHDDLLTPLKQEAEYVIGAVSARKGDVDQALAAFDRVGKQLTDPRSSARARASAALLRYQKGKLTADEASEVIETARMSWRGDAVEREMLRNLINIYTDSKRYDDVLRTQKAIIDAFPGDAETLTIAGDMSALFHRIFLEGLAEEMPPLKALSLFYEFRDLTPLGDDGDLMIQHLADRLAALDLLDRAAQLLDNQIKFRAKGETRSKIGARLALLYILNKNPQEAINTLQVTNYGNNAPDLQTTRLQLTAEALMKLDKNEEALGVIYNDTTPTGALLRLDILWQMKDWPNISNRAEDILSARPNLTDPLTLKETEVLLKLALAYTFESDYTQLRYLRDYYSGLIPDTAYKQIFDYITNDTTPLDPEDFNLLAQQISRTEGFLGTFKDKIANGKLSEAVK